MEELDLLKKDWKKNDHISRQVSENDIYAMLQKRSSSIVKWILIIGIFEFLLLNAFTFLYNDEDVIIEAKLSKYIIYYNYLVYFSIGVALFFMYLFYKNYKSISTVSSTKTLMNSILKVRKTVNYWIGYNLVFTVLVSAVVLYLGFLNDPKFIQIKEVLFDGNHKLKILILLLIVVVTIGFMLLFVWLFYKLLYGILLKKLYRNYQELKKIDL